MRSPDSAPARPDLGWLRHRRVAAHHIEYVHPPRHPTSNAPAPAPPEHPPSLDLGHPVPSSLDLGPAAAAPLALPAVGPAAVARRSRERALPYPRVQPGATVVLSAARPTVTLTRLQSGIGQLRISLARGADAGDLALGLVCETTDGATYVLQRLGDVQATPATPLPLVRLAAVQGVDTFLVDLRQVRRLRRALLYGYSPAVAVLAWDGVVTTTTHDGSRVEAPFELPALSGTVALLTGYAVHGELVLRAELEPFAGPPETAAEAYGYHAGWLGGRLPVR